MKNKILPGFTGHHHSEETKAMMSESHLKRGDRPPVIKMYGASNPAWKGGVTPEVMRVRRSLAYRKWRTEVFERDNYICQKCGVRGVKLHADHIKPFASFPDLRLDVSNGRTLCVPCHVATPTYLKKPRRLSTSGVPTASGV
jgi:hypothetical protein